MHDERIKELSADLAEYTGQLLDADSDADTCYVVEKVCRAFERACIHDDCDALAGRIIRDAQDDCTLEYDLECLEETTEIRGNALASGDDGIDSEAEESIITDLEGGNPWVWFMARVTCKVPGYDAVGDDYLGCCNYDSREQFEEPGGYYDDMCVQARDSLQSNLRRELELSRAG
jgi:hypothetical protein